MTCILNFLRVQWNSPSKPDARSLRWRCLCLRFALTTAKRRRSPLAIMLDFTSRRLWRNNSLLVESLECCLNACSWVLADSRALRRKWSPSMVYVQLINKDRVWRRRDRLSSTPDLCALSVTLPVTDEWPISPADGLHWTSGGTVSSSSNITGATGDLSSSVCKAQWPDAATISGSRLNCGKLR